MEDIGPTLQRARRRATWIVAVGTVLGGVGGVVLALTSDSGLAGILIVIGIACAVGGLAGAVTLALHLTGLLPELSRPLAGLDRATRQAVNRSIRTATPIPPLDGELALRGAERARALALLLPYQTAQLVLLYVGIGGPQLAQLTSDEPWQIWFSRIFVAAVAVTAVAFVAWARRRTAAARRYLLVVEPAA
ncbi:hypothetical protein ASG04_14475 [Curtobacterium sp. Leaf183]|uniref:hypothetical protein n=1 Tax=Curtobacterium sp. Leaf183 TaxID=1736291 RepID=UPI0006F5AF32|nr:hypothetical protein [Curtobacterium sp. Leaf183]KQS08308.1 hypothetical protein ASG04_14475 [Curtobacterium sp. Leaf183]